jgi:outer membrane protein assembly factor BamB
MKKILLVLTFMIMILSCSEKSKQEVWPKYRGPDGTGIAALNSRPPISLDENNLRWKTELPAGFSSPVIWDDKIYLTGAEEESKKLSTICVSKKDGRILWQADIQIETIESHHPISNSAQNSTVTDGNLVVSCFGSCGLLCYNTSGELLWKYPGSCARYMYGNAASPIIKDNMVIYVHDDGDNRFIAALDKTTGAELWKTHLSHPELSNQAGQSTPCIYKDMVILHKVEQIAAFSLPDGKVIWNHTILTEAASSPIIADKKVIVSCWSNLSDELERPLYPDFEKLVKKYDSDYNNKISIDELPEDLMLYERAEVNNLPMSSGTIKRFFGWFDSNSDNEIEKEEWISTIEEIKSEYFRPSGLVAINAESTGDLSDSAVIWRISKGMSEVPTPIYYKNRLYMIKDGGILTCINPETGEIIYQKRIGAPGAYLASPVIANDQLFVCGYNGKVTVLKTGDEFEILAQSDLNDNIAATPAIVGNSIYLRTKTALLAYQNKM